jgi:hypothetical protein
MTARKWLFFSGLQLVGCVATSYGRLALESESLLFRCFAVLGFLLLLPGHLVAVAVSETFFTRSIYYPVAVASNAMFWFFCSWSWRTVREHLLGTLSHQYRFALQTSSAVFIAVNIMHFLRPASCYDCFLGHGLPFTLYHEGGYAGGASIVWRGLVADVGVVVASGLLLGQAWRWFSGRRAL